MTTREQITELINQFSLHADDVFLHNVKKYKIITRRGYKKIQKDMKIDIVFSMTGSGSDYAYIKAVGEMGAFGKTTKRETFGEASPHNSTFNYPAAVAQKRAEGRVILELAGLYQKGYMTEDEVDEQLMSEQIREKATKVGTASVDSALEKMGLSPSSVLSKTPLQPK